MTEAEILDLVFRPGFSTADEITEVSGRGVGLDVVQSVLAPPEGHGQHRNPQRAQAPPSA